MNVWKNAKIMSKRVAIVTGSTKGIGKAIAIRLAKENITVIVTGRDTEQGEAVTAQIINDGGEAYYYRVDLSNLPDVESFCQQITERFQSLDILVNNAGMSGYMGPIASTPLIQLSSVFRVNVESLFLTCQRLLPLLLKSQNGRIINISSIAYRMNPANSGTYNMSKAALNSFTQTLAKEIGPQGVTVNAIAPGLILTERIMQERLPGLAKKAGVTIQEMQDALTKGTSTQQLTTPEDIAAMVTFLASNEAGAITGQIINISSGV